MINSQHHFDASHQFAIVADIGGTNARFSRIDLNHWIADKVEVYPCANFPSLSDALVYYQKNQNLYAIKYVAIAIACPVTDDLVRMTNFHWQFSIREMKETLNINELQVMNDFTAAAMSVPLLNNDEKVQIGTGTADLSKPMVILGAGTGLGVAHLIPTASEFIPLAGEGGHATWAAQTEQEWFIQRHLSTKYGHVSCERLLSGTGLESLYLALAAYQQKDVTPLTAAQIASLALNNECELAHATVMQFFASLGCYAGDLALTLGTLGGVYIAGGIVPKLLPLMKESDFRMRFENKGRASTFNRKISTHVIVAEYPGLVGAAAYLKQVMEKDTYDI
ncbi:glucokinase [Legionella hackeliae]|uniref:Glucokinase n=1 Tax=Legionella hackeliae TaxID=449 RepID=A0A0A8UUU5_LEGHA|nr:glucokinase [Legionella hackeliae]KTD13858.1 glucokinase [Legionella hackeliae]CEK10559.1 Glucokinase [Legionella hackeliae]STX47299.1 glucokinase [Legionella hackeliae]